MTTKNKFYIVEIVVCEYDGTREEWKAAGTVVAERATKRGAQVIADALIQKAEEYA